MNNCPGISSGKSAATMSARFNSGVGPGLRMVSCFRLLRIGNFRVNYEISEEPEGTVTILAIGVKERNRVRIGGEIIKL